MTTKELSNVKQLISSKYKADWILASLYITKEEYYDIIMNLFDTTECVIWQEETRPTSYNRYVEASMFRITVLLWLGHDPCIKVDITNAFDGTHKYTTFTNQDKGAFVDINRLVNWLEDNRPELTNDIDRLNWIFESVYNEILYKLDLEIKRVLNLIYENTI
jgi:hypothetical protein